MAFRQFQLADIGQVTIYKRRGSRQIRLTVDHSGKIKISQPTWVPYAAGVQFAESKRVWLTAQLQANVAAVLIDGQNIGKQHRLSLVGDPSVVTPRSRLSRDGTITVRHAVTASAAEDKVQAVARAAAIRALRSEAEAVLPPRLRQLAEQHNLPFRSVGIRQLKGRWGSCDQSANITLNLFLMQLPWELIDYVLLHELTHTKLMRHGAPFWQQMAQYDPATPIHRRQLRAYQPIIF